MASRPWNSYRLAKALEEYGIVVLRVGAEYVFDLSYYSAKITRARRDYGEDNIKKGELYLYRYSREYYYYGPIRTPLSKMRDEVQKQIGSKGTVLMKVSENTVILGLIKR